jgi:hypothetical protein
MPWRGALPRPERRFFDATQRAYKLATTRPEERVNVDMSWVEIDRICQEKADAEEDFRRELERKERPLRSSAAPLSDDQLLAKLRELGLDVDRDGVERLCEGALSAEEVADPIVKKLNLTNDMKGDWIWIILCALWQRWWPDRPCLELLDDKVQAGYDKNAENNPHAAAVAWLDAWADVLRLCDATGISSITEFDDRFPMTQFLFNWSQDLAMALEDAGPDNEETGQALIDFCEESLRRFPDEDRRRRLGRPRDGSRWGAMTPARVAAGRSTRSAVFEVGVTGETTAFANAMIFDGVSAELREGCVRRRSALSGSGR